MYTKILNLLVIALAVPLLIIGSSRLTAGLQHQRPLSAVIAMAAVFVTGLLLVVAGGLGLRSGRDPDLRILIGAMFLSSISVLFQLTRA